MKYLQKEPFSVPVAGPEVTQADWDAIFTPKCSKCRLPFNDTNRSDMQREDGICGQCWHDDCQRWEDEQGVPIGHRFTHPGPNYKKGRKGKKS